MVFGRFINKFNLVVNWDEQNKSISRTLKAQGLNVFSTENKKLVWSLKQSKCQLLEPITTHLDVVSDLELDYNRIYYQILLELLEILGKTLPISPSLINLHHYSMI